MVVAIIASEGHLAKMPQVQSLVVEFLVATGSINAYAKLRHNITIRQQWGIAL